MDISLSIGSLQLYGIVFLIGSFSAATLSDLRRMSAQSEFVEIWAVFTGIFFALDLAWLILYPPENPLWVLLKWALVLVFVLLSNSYFGVLFKIAKGDILACTAVLILLPFIVGILFIVALKIIDLILRPALRRAGAGGAYPFMPVVFVAAGLLFALEIFYLRWNVITLPFG